MNQSSKANKLTINFHTDIPGIKTNSYFPFQHPTCKKKKVKIEVNKIMNPSDFEERKYNSKKIKTRIKRLKL